MRFDVALGTVLMCAAPLLASAAAAQPQAAPDVSAYAWAGACKDCHKEIHEAWSRTKHARAIQRLDSSERRTECVQCHVTGANQLVDVKGADDVNAGVQCEACHGPGAAHATDATVLTGLVKKPGAATCEACHNERSPKFKGFFYDGMAVLSHRVK
jgi:hypothetical protein